MAIQIISTVKALRQEVVKIQQAGKTTGFVPTMGALHDGHRSLVLRSVAENDVTVVSIFVNPTQFNNAGDLAKYPRTPERDLALLEAAGCDMIFAPAAGEIYSPQEINAGFDFDFQGLDKVMEGKFRPGHFNGVVQIVSKLFTLVQPQRAYFGEKDFQQLAIIHLMVKTLNFNVEIIDCPTVREPDGLAMSSRNERLLPEQRKTAAKISKILFESRNFAGKISPAELSARVIEQINATDGLELEYFETVNAATLQTAENWDEPAVGCIAVFCGEVRLIDNIRF